MDITFKNAQIQKLCENIKKATREFGKDYAEKLFQRIQEMEASDSMEILKKEAVGSFPHPLRGKRKGFWSVTIKAKLRIILTINMDKKEYIIKDNIDYNKIISVKIENVEDYHD